MTHYHFDVALDGELRRDKAGMELASVAAARVQAARLAADLVTGAENAVEPARDFEVRVTTESGLILFCLNLVITDAPAMVR